MKDREDTLYEAHEAQIRAAQPEFERLITQVTGWQGVSDLAAWMVNLLVANQGTSSIDEVRPPCWQEHTPMGISQFTAMLAQISDHSPDSPEIQAQVATYRQRLRDQFEL